MNLLALAVSCTAIVAAIVAAVAFGLSRDVASAFGQPGLAPWLCLLPVGILLAGAYSSLQLWSSPVATEFSVTPNRRVS